MPKSLPVRVRNPIGSSVFVRAQRVLEVHPLLLFQITSHVPKVPKQPLMLDAPLESFFWKLWSDTEGGKPEESEEGSQRLSLSDPLPPIRPSSAQQNQEPYDEARMLGSQREALEKEKCDAKLGRGRAGEDTDLFFLTQVCAHVLCVCLVLSQPHL